MSKVIKIKKDMNKARKNKEESSLAILRIVLAELENKKVENKLEEVEQLSNKQVETVLTGQLKKLDQELEGLIKAGRDQSNVLTQKEIVLSYLPKQLTTEQIEKVIKGKIKENKITSLAEQGKLMGILSKELKGKANLGEVSKLVRELLGG